MDSDRERIEVEIYVDGECQREDRDRDIGGE